MKNFSILIISFLLWTDLYSQNCFDAANVYSFEFNGVQYDIVKENKSWLMAAECADKMGGILAEINSQAEQDTIFYHLNNAGISAADIVAPDGGNASYVWIGGTDLDEEGKWIWDGSYDGLGSQFWQGARTGNVVGGLYNNWGNEPDNFGEQDATGMAFTNWPYGKAGQWNDIAISNKLYFIIEYDNSTVKLSDVNYSYSSQYILIYPSFKFDFDSVQVHVNDSLNSTIFNVMKEDSILISDYSVSESKNVSVRIYAFENGKAANSRKHNIEIFKKLNPINSYYTDFEESPSSDFMGENFLITKEFGFLSKAIHSPHNYEANKDYTYTLLKPIIVNQTNPMMSYSDIAIVEPGAEGSVFGEVAFNDYVVVEGSKKLGEWIPVIIGYDSNLFPEWKNAWSSGGLYRKLFKTHQINLTDTFDPGDTVLIRFRLHSNSTVTGWGWSIDSLQIQDFPLGTSSYDGVEFSFSLKQNYPNPFNPTTTIKFNLPERLHVTLSVFDILGRKIVELLNEEKIAGEYEVQFNSLSASGGKGLSSGVYFYKITAGSYSSVRKLNLIK
ncbi:MAG: T9SS type A sorting domain-containing protein [Bacteroidetes bacterium]|nr:T9SS type A sorting domain-containing protein [Bacteroidota bacterium]